jgi:hypothetical protein
MSDCIGRGCMRESMKEEIDRLRGQNDRLRDELVALQAKASIMRELVREMAEESYVPRLWIERAEKVLEGTK